MVWIGNATAAAMSVAWPSRYPNSRRRKRAAAREVHTKMPCRRALLAMGGLRVTVEVGPEMAGDGSGAGCAERRAALPARRWAVKPAVHHVSRATPSCSGRCGVTLQARARRDCDGRGLATFFGALAVAKAQLLVAAKLPEMCHSSGLPTSRRSQASLRPVLPQCSRWPRACRQYYPKQSLYSSQPLTPDLT